jgi:hypothetical protein
LWWDSVAASEGLGFIEGGLQVVHARMYTGGGCTQEHDTRSRASTGTTSTGAAISRAHTCQSTPTAGDTCQTCQIRVRSRTGVVRARKQSTHAAEHTRFYWHTRQIKDGSSAQRSTHAIEHARSRVPSISCPSGGICSPSPGRTREPRSTHARETEHACSKACTHWGGEGRGCSLARRECSLA